MRKNKKQKIIGVDARFYGPVGKGLGRYTKEVLDRVLKLDKENKYVIFLSPENYKSFDDSPRNVRKVLIKARWYTLHEQIVMPFYILREKVNLMYFPHFNVSLFCPVKFIVTIHDLILTKYPTQRASTLSPFFYKIKNLAYKLIIRHAVKASEKIISVSNFTKNDIVNQFGISEDKIRVTYEGVFDFSKTDKKRNDKDIEISYNIKKPFILYVGNAYPHKNLEGLIEIFSKIRKKGISLRLVLVGKEDYFYERVKLFAKGFENARNDIIFPGYVSDAQLANFYRDALFYVFPSLYEGFGLPPLEAMSFSCPVLSSNKSSMPEILGDACEYFDPENKEDFELKILKMLKDADLRKALIIMGAKKIKKYSWDKCAKETFEIFRKQNIC